MAHALNASQMTSSLAAPAEKTKPAGPSFLARWYNALLESRHQAALREIRRHESLVGGFGTLDHALDHSALPFKR